MRDLSLALLRVAQIEARLTSKHPRATKDPHLVALLRSLQDELNDQLVVAESEGGE